jgi:glycosyltransferase involved in cell wall biosynthesis
MHTPRYSVIIPVYNRPQEIAELLESLVNQSFTDFEVIIVEDGSTITSKSVYEQYSSRLSMQYLVKPNSGPGPSRNMGFAHARGDYFVVFDSDCLLPPHYFHAVENFLKREPVDAWGGPDRGMKDFTPLQQAMAFTMSSLFTTGGIRGKSERGFQPRSFNMGFSRQVYEKTGGFQFDRFAEDIELSIRIRKMGFRTALIPDAFVYHKRRATLGEFFRQTSNFGKGRALISRVHPGEVKPVHWFPFLFFAGLVSVPFLSLFFPAIAKWLLFLYLLYMLLVWMDALLSLRSFSVACLCIPALFVQLIGYGTGFIKTLFARHSG